MVEKPPSRVKFTQGRVRSFKCKLGSNESLVWDSGEKTLALRARSSGVKSFYFQSRLNGKVLKIKIGDTSDTLVTIDYARKIARRYQSQIDQGLDPRLIRAARIADAEKARERINLEQTKFEDLWEDYLSANKCHWSDSYKHDHDKAMQQGGQKRKRSKKRSAQGVLYPLRGVALSDINADLLRAWLIKENASRPTVASTGFRMLRAALNWADGTSKYSEVLSVDRLFKNKELKRVVSKPKARRDVLLHQQLPAWFRAVEKECSPSVAAYLKGLLLTGARREELAQLKWDDVDLKWSAIRIRDKVDGERQIPLTPYFKSLIEALPKINCWVFSSETSRSGRLVDPYRAHKRALDSEALPHITLHGLRRSFGSLSEWVECPVGVVAQIQGHKPSALAEKHYRVRPLDLLALWHTRIEDEILKFAGVVIH